MKELGTIYSATSIPDILDIGDMLGKATTHEKGYIQIPSDAEGHENLLNIAERAQWTINRGMGAIGHALATSDSIDEVTQDLGWLLNGLADLNTQLSNAEEAIKESQRHLSDKEDKKMNHSIKTSFQEAMLLVDYAIKTALVELSELDQQSIKTLQSNATTKTEIITLLTGVESAKNSLIQASRAAKGLIHKNIEVVQ